MWLFTTTGFYTVVAHNDMPDTLIVRARVKKDLIDLKKDYMPELSKITFHINYDYPYRSFISNADFGKGLAKMAMDINYEKFKTEVARKQGYRRSNLYTSVWSLMIKVENDAKRITHYFTRGYKQVAEPGEQPRIKPRSALYTQDRFGGISRLGDTKEEQGLDGPEELGFDLGDANST